VARLCYRICANLLTYYLLSDVAAMLAAMIPEVSLLTRLLAINFIKKNLL